ncbi:MAG: hypothetical protein AB8I69_12330 [Anaerolineae bacterium]
MKARQFTRVGLVVVPVLLLLGCLPSPQVTEDEPTAEPTPLPSVKPTATRWPTAIPSPTATLLPTLTPHPTWTPRPTWTPIPAQTPTATPLPFPTLESDAMQAFIAEMLATNGGCELPCWWGITPGETRWDDMVQFFSERGVYVEEGGELDLQYQISWHGDRPVYDSMLEVTFHREGDWVQGVTVRNTRRSASSSDDFTTLWQRYALQPVLSRHGVPSQVYLNLTVGAPCIGGGNFPDYAMWVMYVEQGIAIRYSGLALLDNEKWLVCPVFGQLRMIEIRLQAADAGTELVAPESEVFDPGGEFSIYGFLPDLAEMSTQAFYDAFSPPEPRTCVVVPDPDPLYEEVVLSPDPQALSPEAEDALLVDMLANNGGCELPCWWGITPGVTAWEDAQQQFLSYGKSISSWSWTADTWGTGHKVGLLGRHESYPFDYVVEHIIYEQDGIVSLIGAQGHVPGWPADEWSLSPRFVQDWDRYTLDQVLARFGKPSQVLLHYWFDHESLFSVGVFYEDRGILIEYMGLAQGEREAGEYHFDPVVICPTRSQLTDIHIWLKSSEMEPSLIDVFVDGGGGYLGLLPFQNTPSLEDATGMSLDTFYTTYLDPNADVCMEAQWDLGDCLP